MELAALPVVQSRANALFKRLRALAGAAQKQRREGVAILEGVHLADAYLQSFHPSAAAHAAVASAATAMERVVVSQTAAGRADVRDIVARIEARWPDRVTVFDDTLFEQVSPVSDGGVGLLLLIAAPHSTLADATDAVAITRNCVVLDGVQDAGNVGSILRSAAAAGVTLAICMPGTATVWSTKVLRAAMGAHFVMDIIEQVTPEAVAAALAVPVVITDSHATQTIYDAALSRPLAWIMGNEGAGVSAFWRERAAVRLTIPQPGRIESLNVAAAAAVCLFEQARQQRVARP